MVIWGAWVDNINEGGGPSSHFPGGNFQALLTLEHHATLLISALPRPTGLVDTTPVTFGLPSVRDEDSRSTLRHGWNDMELTG